MHCRRRFDETAAIEGDYFARRGLEEELSVGCEANESARGHGALSALNRHVASEPKEVSLRERSPGGGEPDGVGFAQMTQNTPPKFIGIHCGSPAGHQAPGRERSALSERRHFGRPVDIEADPCGEEPVSFFEQNAAHFGRPIGRKTDDVIRPLHEHREAETAKRFSGQSRRRCGGCPSGINPFKRQSDAGMKIPAGALPCAAVLSASCCLQVCKDRAIDRQAVCSIERAGEREN